MLTMKAVVCDIQKRRLLDIEHLTVNVGAFYGLLGANGAGKTTLLKVISGDMPYDGELLFHGKALQDWPARNRARHLSVLPQASQLSFPFNGEEVVSLGLTPLCISQREGRKQVRHHMKLTDCWQFAGRSYTSLSGGERQRVQLARVLLQLSQADEVPLLLLDEPTSAQDLGQQHKILNLAKQLCEEKDYGVIAILHDLNQVIRYCQRCCLLQDGRLTHEGDPSTLLSNDVIESHWQYCPERVRLNNGQLALI